MPVSLAARLATRIDTWNGQRLAREFADGWPARTSPDIRFHRTPLAQYRYRLRDTAGPDAPTVVFLADAPVTLERYDALLDRLASDYRVIVFEGAGMGFSAPDPAYRFGFRETNDDVAAFLRAVAGPDATGGRGAILAFSCVAGLGAIDIAVRHPDLVRGLFLLQTADWDTMLAWKMRRDPTGVLGRPVLGQLAMKRLGAKRAPGWFKQALGRRDQMGPFCDCAAEAFGHGSQFALASAFQRYLAGPSPLGTPHQPTTIVWGTLDASHEPMREPGTGERSARQIAPRARFHALDHVGHFPDLQDPERVVGLLDEFTTELNR